MKSAALPPIHPNSSPGRLPGAATLLQTVLVVGCAAPPFPPPPEPQPPGPGWELFDAEGNPVGVDAVVAAARRVDVLFMGELHGNPGAHDFQLHLLEALVRDAQDVARPLILSMEMFERDVQLVVDEYLEGIITEDQFLAAARPWENYRRDYRPLVELAREQDLPVLAANAPRRYVNRVARLGPEALDDLLPEALAWLPPLPYPGPSEAYRAEWNRRMEALAHGHAPAHGDDSALMAQALWDASMAWFIHLALDRGRGSAPEVPRDESPPAGPLVVHLTGSFHVEGGTGTPEALEHYRPGVMYRIITTRTVQDPEALPTAVEEAVAEEAADFLLLSLPGSVPGETGSLER